MNNGRRRVTNSLNWKKEEDMDRKGIPVIVQVAMITVLVLVILAGLYFAGVDMSWLRVR